MELFTQYASLLSQAGKAISEVAGDENIKQGASSFFGWLKGLFQGKPKAQAVIDNFLQNPAQPELLEKELPELLSPEQAGELSAQLETLAKTFAASNQTVTITGNQNIFIGGQVGGKINIKLG
jgi:lipopolysaccharide assembly outer membrane protein LptD (OstA)